MIYYPNAKINIGLNIVSRRDDGFHDIETLFYPVRGLTDILEIIAVDGKLNSIEFSQSGIQIDDQPDANLCVKAYKLLADKYGLPRVKMHLHKMIPMGAGLGGGSADAAFTLLALNQLLDRPLDKVQLANLALQLGSDCPFFLLNRPAIGKGRGDKLQEVSFELSGYWILLVNPGIHVGTKEAYEGCIPQKWESSLETLIGEPIAKWNELLSNDFERTVFVKHPKIMNIKNELYSMGAVYASMSGSGSTVFGIFQTKPSVPDDFKAYFTHVSLM
ncbi:4-(cytidine 5'-diphospho)-2-C-methyl-D-erythritol kinase [Tenuifilum thalassicum]|uniref:4-diphosphocytidyl-2-C-methyl-D-erythritol kinase n=2 Tax=Tenuifilum thalassicum TaxID=2590900 RepID=A0A7D4BCU8_9BACT|nr:4-(cytidine 5'-diphospho)-2-C-methyl-D-erythritol kinase [Tenuifilum thalassicum]